MRMTYHFISFKYACLCVTKQSLSFGTINNVCVGVHQSHNQSMKIVHIERDTRTRCLEKAKVARPNAPIPPLVVAHCILSHIVI